MEPYELKVHQLTFNEDQITEDSLDSFSNVVHYDSALIDCKTGRKPNTQHVSNSLQFAWSNSIYQTTPSTQPVLSSNQIRATRSHDQFLPTPFQTIAPSPISHPEVAPTVLLSTKGEFAQEFGRLIKDVYSEVEVPFQPFRNQTTIPDWIFLQQPQYKDPHTFGKPPEHIQAQPSKVKVTHVYNQSVCSNIPSTAVYEHVTPVPGQTYQTTARTGTRRNQSLPQTDLSGSTTAGFTTLQQVISNTTAARHHTRLSSGSVPVYNMEADRGAEADGDNVRSTEPFESVAEALHLQQSVIGNKATTVTPVSADVVAQVVAEAQRKIQMGATPTNIPSNLSTPTPVEMQGSTQPIANQGSGPAQPTDFVLPPAPQLQNTATTQELIRLYGLDITRNSDGGSNVVKPMSQPGVPIRHIPQNAPIHSMQGIGALPGSTQPTLPNTADLLEDTLSVASSNSELESLNENATEKFLQSLPPFRPVNLKDLMPEMGPKHEVRYSPPVKETSFRPVNNKPESNETQKLDTPDYQTFVTDSGIFSPTAEKLAPTESLTPISSLVPKPGPLFRSTPRKQPTGIQSQFNKPTLSTSSSIDNAQYADICKEKAKLEGQLEMLSIEAQATLQERAELQAQVASLKLKLLGQKGNKTDPEKERLKTDVESLKQVRISLENSLTDLQRQMEVKTEEGRNLQEEFSQAQDLCDRLNLKMKEVRDDLRTKEMTIQALKNKVAELYVEVQSSVHIKMEADNETRAARSELLSLQSTKDWYQNQLEVATKARSELQKDLTLLQAQASSQSSIIERLKTENAKLRQQFTDIQNKALKEKELLAKHLEAIESDMMDREAAFQEIQRERSFLEDAFSNKIQTAEDEKNRISLLLQMTNDLENQLDKAHNDLKKKQNQIVQLENENIELMKKLSLSQEAVIEKETVIEDLKQSMIELEARLKAFQNSIVGKDDEILKLKEEKAKTEIALNAALQEKMDVDEVLDGLKADMGKVETSFKLMRQELNTKSVEVHRVKTDGKVSEEQVDNLKKDLENEKRMYELMKSQFDDKSEQFNEIQGQKVNLESEVLLLREKLSAVEVAHNEALKQKQALDDELTNTKDQLEEVKGKLKVESEIESEAKQKSSVDNEEYVKVKSECESLKDKVTKIEKDSKKDLMKQKAKAAKLTQDLNAVKGELIERQKTYDESMEKISEKLREVWEDKERLEVELSAAETRHRLSIREQKDPMEAELQKLASDLEKVRLEKQRVEGQVLELQHARDHDLRQYQLQLSALEEELAQSEEAQRESAVTIETNQELSLELEKEKGRLAGLMQSNATLKQHVAQLEDALASRESTLVDMQTQWQEALRIHEQESTANLKRVQTLEESLQKEKESQRDVRKQIGLKITENKKIQRQNDRLKQDAESLKQDLAQRVQEVGVLEAELETNKQEVLSRQSEMAVLESENKRVQRELERVQQQLQDNLAREPVILEQIKSLQWQLELKSAELEGSQEQLKLSEQRQLTEIDSMKHVIQEKSGEIDSLKLDINTLKLEKQQQQAKLTELRSALKSSIQHHKLTQKMSRLRSSVGGGGDAGDLELPPLPFDMDDMDKLLQETTVRALESKPLDNLQNCLLNLRSEISGLQAQMDDHNSTLQNSTSTWNTLEQQVQQLCTVVQTITNTTVESSTTNSLAAAAVQMADNVFDV